MPRTCSRPCAFEVKKAKKTESHQTLKKHTTKHIHSSPTTATVGRTHTIVRFQTRIVEKSERRISGGSYMCWMDFHNATLCCGFLCARLISFYSVSILLLFCVSSSLFPATTPRATTPHLYRTGYHAFTTTARLPRLSLSRLPRHSSLFYSWVITPELSRSTTHVHRVITPAIVSSL